MDAAEALENLQGMGFCLAACERALRVSENSLDRCVEECGREMLGDLTKLRGVL
jgi:hypothetical protein